MASMAKHKPSRSRSGFARWRPWVQASFLLAWLNPLLLRWYAVCSPVFHCDSCPLSTFACPIGTLARFGAIHTAPFLALGILLICGAAMGSLICGWVCPFGFFQDLLGRIPLPKWAIPRWLGYTRYVVLAAMVGAVPYYFGEESPWYICRLCPAGAIEAALPNTVHQIIARSPVVWPSAAKLSVLAVLLAAALFTWRPWCTVFCPLGAIYSLCNRFSVFFVGFRQSQCTDCDLCRQSCRYRGAGERRAATSGCVRCLECVHCEAIVVGTILGPAGRGEKTQA